VLPTERTLLSTHDDQSAGPTGRRPPDVQETTMSEQNTNRFRPTSDDRTLDEVEAHKIYSGSDRGIKHDVDDVTWDEDQTEGHRFSSSDVNVKHDVEDVAWEDEGTEGHAARFKG
jgi:hypothetical protein